MKRKVVNTLVIGSQLLIVGLFFVTVFSEKVSVKKYVTTIHNDNINKIATSVSLLFEEEEVVPVVSITEDLTLKELPSVDELEAENETKTEENKQEEVIESTPLVSLDSSKYRSVEAKGFVVTDNNKTYSLSDYEFNVVVAVVAGEGGNNLDDALGVVSVILNRCESNQWGYLGSSPYSQVTAAGQFSVYLENIYLKYMPGGSSYGGSIYNNAKQAVIDGFNGIRNNNYLGFRAWFINGYSDNYIVENGNRYK